MTNMQVDYQPYLNIACLLEIYYDEGMRIQNYDKMKEGIKMFMKIKLICIKIGHIKSAFGIN